MRDGWPGAAICDSGGFGVVAREAANHGPTRWERERLLRCSGRPQVGDEVRIEQESAYGFGLLAFEADGECDIVVGSKQPNIDAIELVVEANIRNRRQIDDAVTNADKLRIHSKGLSG